MKKLIPVVMAVILAFALFTPQQGSSANQKLNEIERKLQQAKNSKAAAERKAKEAQQRISQIQVERVQTEKNLVAVYAKIDEATEKLEELDNNINTVETDLEQTEQEIVEANDRIMARDDLLRSRLRLMYTNGTVSYLEVLLSATSFSDFLDRYNSLQSLVGQDKEILESNIRDHELVIVKKGELEGQLLELVDLYTEQEETMNNLLVREKEAEVMIASLNVEEQNLGDISEEQEQIMIAAAAEEAKLQAEANQLKAFYLGGLLRYPLPQVYRVSSNFGTRTHPITGKKGSFHSGIDFAAPNGTNILAAESGSVITAGWLGGYGNTVIINHGGLDGDLWTLYAHIRPNGIKVKVGDVVKRGDVIAEVGTTGSSTGYHLHFEVRLNEKAVDPKKYLNMN